MVYFFLSYNKMNIVNVTLIGIILYLLYLIFKESSESFQTLSVKLLATQELEKGQQLAAEDPELNPIQDEGDLSKRNEILNRLKEEVPRLEDSIKSLRDSLGCDCLLPEEGESKTQEDVDKQEIITKLENNLNTIKMKINSIESLIGDYTYFLENKEQIRSIIEETWLSSDHKANAIEKALIKFKASGRSQTAEEIAKEFINTDELHADGKTLIESLINSSGLTSNGAQFPLVDFKGNGLTKALTLFDEGVHPNEAVQQAVSELLPIQQSGNCLNGKKAIYGCCNCDGQDSEWYCEDYCA
jgi:hypothetical protein